MHEVSTREEVVVDVLHDPNVPLAWVQRALTSVLDLEEEQAQALVMVLTTKGAVQLPTHSREPAKNAVILASLGIRTRIGWA